MTGRGEHAQSAHVVERQRDGLPGEVAGTSGVPWLQGHKVELPDPIEGYVRRPELEARCALTERRLTVLHAPGGFGKTALLARCCRALREGGVAVAWLSLDEEDGPGSVATYLTLAFERAGVESFGAGRGGDGDSVAQAPGPEADSQADYRINLLIRALQRHDAPCVLVLDELERLQSPEAVAALNALLHRVPGNLHMAMAYRERPPGLEVAMFAFEGRAATVTVEDLRFSMPHISRFFDRRLSRRELGSVLANSAGWPIALRIYRNAERVGAAGPTAGGGDDMVAGWIETRLWRGISDEDREFVLDVALFDWIDPDLIEEAAGARNPGRRLASMGAFAGLFSTTGGDGSAMQLHPMIKDYCERRRFEEDPERFRSLHRRIAEALARRARVVEALRHAVEVGDTELLGRLAEGTGGVKLWLEQGLETLRTVDRHLSEDVLSRYPRMALLRCVALTVSGDVEAAKRIYDATAVRTAGFSRDRQGGDDMALQIDHLMVHGLVEMCGCKSYGGPMAEMLPLAIAAADESDTAPLFRGVFSLGICMMQNQRTAFDTAVEWAERAREAFGPGSPYLAHVDFQLGSVAMARGRAAEAERCYVRALKVARASHLRDSGAMMLGQVLSLELELERSALVPRPEGARLSPRLLGESAAWFDIYAANTETGAELALQRGSPQAALAVVDQARAYALHTERAPLVRFFSALRVRVLVAGGEIEGAERAWRIGRLPEDAAECVDLESQSWREAEMLACARLRLHAAKGALNAARELGAALVAVAEKRQLVRTSMRGLALLMALEYRCGDEARARAHLVESLRLFAETGYARPLACMRAVVSALVDEIAGGRGVDDDVRKAAVRLGEAMRDSSNAALLPRHARLTQREVDVLVRLERQRDKEIAEDLNLSYDGLRYRVNRIFAKLGARSRLDAVHRARALGVLAPPDDSVVAEP